MKRNYELSQIVVAQASFESGYEAAQHLLAKTDITALFIANNVMTMGGMGYIQEKRIRVPEELAVIGFDDYDWTKITSPPLTVIRQPCFEIGEKAADTMIKRIEKNDDGTKFKEYRLPTELVLRGSC